MSTIDPKLDVPDLVLNAEDLGKLVRSQRKALGLTTSALSAKANIARKTLYDLESGSTTSTSTVFAVLGALGMAFRMTTAQPNLDRLSELFADEPEDEDEQDQKTSYRHSPG